MQSTLARAALILYAALAALPLRYHAVSTGLDPSWAFALNFAHARGLVFPTQAAYTYGPLAYLALPMPVGSNLAAGIAFQLAAWLSFAALLAWIAFRRPLPILPLALFTAGVVLGAGSFTTFGYAGVDTFLVFLALLCAASGLVEAAAAIAVLLFFVKFSSAISVASALVLLAALRPSRRAVLALALSPLLIALVAIFAISPSPAEWIRYVRLGLDASSGYSEVMSLPGAPGLAEKALLPLAAWLVLAAVLCWRKAGSWPFALACAGPLFLEFKHSFVREPGHYAIVVLFLPLLWGVVALFTDFRRRGAPYLAAAFALPLVAWYPLGASQLPRLWHSPIPAIPALPAAPTPAALAPDRLPDSLLARVAGHSIAPFPNECAYAAANPALDWRLFPLFQMYLAYTPFLDGLNARFLDDPRRAPAFVLLDWDAIDERHPLLDVPATTLALYRHYEFDSLHGSHMLLRRRSTPRFTAWRTLASQDLRLDQPLRVPPSGRPLAARIRLRWNPRGQLLKFFFRLPEVRLIASSSSGRVLSARIPPAVLDGGTPLNFVPFDFADAESLFAGRPVDRVEAVGIAGAGARYLEPSARVEILEASGATLPFSAPPAPDFTSLRHLGPLDSWRIELLNDTGAIGFHQLEVPDTRGYLRITGWAVVHGAAAGGLWIELDGHPRPARYGQPRRDIAALFGRTDELACGFEATIPAWDLGQAWHDLTVKILAPATAPGYYDGVRTLRFKMESR